MNTTVLSAILLLAAGAAGPESPADQTAARLERRLQSLRSFQADFEQTYRSVSLSSPLTESGRVIFRRPASMRWEYLKPEAKVFLYNDGVFEQYYPEDKQLIRSRVSAEDSGSEILAILTGSKNLREGYAAAAEPPPDGSRGVDRIRLTPLREGEYSHILLDVLRADGLLAGAVFVDFGGNRTEFVFKKLRPDVRVQDRTFELRVPADCEVIDDLGPNPQKKEPL